MHGFIAAQRYRSFVSARPWIFSLVHEREEAVLVLRFAAADLVDEHRWGLTPAA